MKTVLNLNNVNQKAQPLFLGEPMGIQRYDIKKYPIFFDLWRKQHEFHWTPEEVSLSKDRNDYENLSDTEKFIFNSNLKWQTMTDSMLSRSIHEMATYVSNSELEICMVKWADFECLHSYSYTYILENIAKDVGAFFDDILEDKYIRERAVAIKSAYDKLLVGSTDIKTQIFDSVLMTQITEGVSFYISFACSFFFGYRGKMEGNAKIIQLIQRDENLHVDITREIMEAWKRNKTEGFQQIVKDNEQKVYDFYGLATEQEKGWADHLFSQGSLLGLNADVLKGYIEWICNVRLQSLGYKKIYDIKTNPIEGWLDSFGDSGRVQIAPQETELSSYKIGARDTKISDEDFEDFNF